jgi:hypothetical protein
MIIMYLSASCNIMWQKMHENHLPKLYICMSFKKYIGTKYKTLYTQYNIDSQIETLQDKKIYNNKYHSIVDLPIYMKNHYSGMPCTF